MYNFKRGLVGLGAAAVVAASLIGSGAALAQSPAASMAAVDGTGVSRRLLGELPGRALEGDEAAIKTAVEAAGGTYKSTDAQSSATKQQSDIESLITDGVDVLIIVPWDVAAITAGDRRRRGRGHPGHRV